jgi:hypothetical protein
MHARHLSAIALTIAVLLAPAGTARSVTLIPPRPTVDDTYALLTVVNEYRSVPWTIPGYGSFTPTHPLAWSQGLGDAAAVWTQMCVDNFPNGCPPVYDRILQQYFPPWGSYEVGANHAGYWPKLSPEISEVGFMSSPPHAANMLQPNYMQFGAGPYYSAAKDDGFDVEMFSPVAGDDGIPPLPAGAIMPRVPNTYGYDHSRHLLVNYYDPTGKAPTSIVAVYGSTTMTLALVIGKAGFGTYGFTNFDPPGSGCVPLHFEATTAAGWQARWPTTENLLVGVGNTGQNCADRVPSGVAPPPPPGFGAVSITMQHAKHGSTGQINVRATFPSIGDFWPSSTPIDVSLTYGNGGSYTSTLPIECGVPLCLQPNREYNSFVGHYPSPPITLKMSESAAGVWSLAFIAKNAPLGTLASGQLTFTFTVSGQTYLGLANGVLQKNGSLVGH